MTWKLTVHHNPGSLVSAEYECPVHGRFTLDMEREPNGDPPQWVHCNEVEFGCLHACEHVMSAPASVKVRTGEMVRGKSAERPSEKHVLDTSLLADGMPYDEWKARRAKVHRDESLRRVRKAFGTGPKTWVGGK